MKLFLVAAYMITLYVTMRYYLNMLREEGWKNGPYLRKLIGDSLRWLPLLFVLIPSAALAMNYQGLGMALLLVYLLGMQALYLLRLHFGEARTADRPARIRHPFRIAAADMPHSGWKMRALLLLWSLLWGGILAICWIARGTQARKVHLLCAAAFAAQPLAAPIMIYLIRPVEEFVRRHYVSNSGALLDKRKGLQVMLVIGGSESELEEMGRTLQFILAGQMACRLEEIILQSAVDAAQMIRSMETRGLEMLICLVKTNQAEELQAITEIVHPELVLLTSMTAGLQRAGAELFGQHGLCLMNADDEELCKKVCADHVVTFGLESDCDVRGNILSCSAEGVRFTITDSNREPAEYAAVRIGEQQIRFLIGAVAAGRILGMPEEVLTYRMAALPQTEHRMQLVSAPNATWIDDTANEKPEQAREALHMLTRFEGEKILLTSGFIRLGDAQEEENYRVGRAAAEVCSHVILVGDEVAFGLKSGILDMGFRPERLHEAATKEEAKALAEQLETEQEKVVLAENMRDTVIMST